MGTERKKEGLARYGGRPLSAERTAEERAKAIPHDAVCGVCRSVRRLTEQERGENMNTVRRAEYRDIPDILRLLVQVNMVHHNGRPDLFKGPATKYTEEQLRLILTDPDTPVFVCTDREDQVLGYAFCVHKQYTQDNILTDIRTLYIDDLCVDEAARGQGVGRTLYEYVLSYARQTDCYNVTLNVWALNEGAKRFYEKCGLVPQKYGMETIL